MTQTEAFTDTTKATEVVLTYMVPVFVVVRNEGDNQGPYIKKVVVYDETDCFGEDPTHRHNQLDELPPDDPAAIEAVNLIKDGLCEWPSWQFGW